jgi:hypothetical protein
LLLLVDGAWRQWRLMGIDAAPAGAVGAGAGAAGGAALLQLPPLVLPPRVACWPCALCCVVSYTRTHEAWAHSACSREPKTGRMGVWLGCSDGGLGNGGVSRTGHARCTWHMRRVCAVVTHHAAPCVHVRMCASSLGTSACVWRLARVHLGRFAALPLSACKLTWPLECHCRCRGEALGSRRCMCARSPQTTPHPW